MRKSTLFHHKKQLRKSPNQSKTNSDNPQLLLQNPESSAKYCLLQISEETQKNNNRTFTFFQNQHARSYSTEFFNYKKTRNTNELLSPDAKNSFQLQKLNKEEMQQSVVMKSTFSNEMRKTHHPSSNSNTSDSSLQKVKQEIRITELRNDSIRKIRKINYLPFTVEEQKQIENIDQIFKTTPSKQILAILNRTKLSKQLKQNQRMSKIQFQEQSPIRKKSIFNIRNLMLKQKIEESQTTRRKQSPQKRVESPDFLQPKQLHTTNRNVVKMRLKNRYNKSSMSKRQA